VTPTLLLASLALSAPVPKAAAPDLKWRFAKGDTFYVKYEQEATSTVNGAGAGGQANTSVTAFVYKFVVTSAKPDETVLELTFESCKTGHAQAGQAAKLAEEQNVAGKVVTFTLDGKLKVTKVDGAAELAKAAPGAASGMLNEDYLKYNLTTLLTAVPGKPLGKGEKWDAETDQAMTQGLTVKKTMRGTVDGFTDGVAKLTVESDHAWTGSPQAGGGPGAANLQYDLRGEKGQTTVLFDTKAGRLKKWEEAYTIGGGIDLGGGQKLNLTAAMKTTVTVSDEKPKDE
jgi:hypothetical protein